MLILADEHSFLFLEAGRRSPPPFWEEDEEREGEQLLSIVTVRECPGCSGDGLTCGMVMAG